MVSSKQFGAAARDLMFQNAALTRKNGNPDWMALARLSITDYETLRKALTGERQPSDKVISSVAQALKVSPSYFAEYRLRRAQEKFDPKVVGWDEALSNAERLFA